MGNSVKSIGNASFWGCTNLSTIKLPDSVENIDSWAFYGCENLKSLIIPNSVLLLGTNIINRCEKLEQIAIPYNNNLKAEKLVFSLNGDGYKSEKLFDGTIMSMPSFMMDNPKQWGLSLRSVNAYRNGLRNSGGKLILSWKEGRKFNKVVDNYSDIDYYIVEESEQRGLLDNQGNWIIPLNTFYKNIELAGDGYVRICGKNNVYSIINADGKEIIPNSRGYDFIGDYEILTDGFYVKKGRYGGYCDAQGREISMEKLPPTEYDIKADGGYSSVVVIMNGSAKYYKVSKNGRYGLTNAEGEEIVPPELDALEECGKGFLRFKVGDYWGVMNYMGKVTIPTDRGYTKIGNYVSLTKRFPYTMNGYKGECDANGRQISKIRVETPKQNTSVASSSGSSSSSTSSGTTGKKNSGNNTTTIHVEHHHDPVPVQQWQACFGCGGMGTMGCDNCGGSGTKYIGDRLHRCSRCNGRGIIPCNVCYGNKGQYITVYR